jgi:predicted kinase
VVTPRSPRTFTLLIGPPSSGKSTWAAEAEARTGVAIVSRGALQAWLRGQGAPTGTEDHALHRENLKLWVRGSDRDLILDDTHMLRRERSIVVETIHCSELRSDYRVVAVVFTTPLALCWEREQRKPEPLRTPSGRFRAMAAALDANPPAREGYFDTVLYAP